MKKLNPLTSLERSDKWYLGGGNRLIWTPPFPVWLDYPGFWDKAHYYNREIDPVFTWTVLDESGNEIPLKAKNRKWLPSKLTTVYEICDMRYGHSPNSIRAIDVEEIKYCLPNDVLSSTVTFKNNTRRKQTLHFIAWTVQPSYPSKQITWLENLLFQENTISFRKILPPNHSGTPALPVECILSIDRNATSNSINLSEGTTLQPHWRLTPFVEKFKDGKLPDDCKLTAVNDDGLIFMALHVRIVLGAKSVENIGVGFTCSPSKPESKKNIAVISKQKEPWTISDKNWSDYFSGVPYFECSDEFFTKYYWYRWYGLKLMRMTGNEGNYKHPFVCEGIGYFRAPISYSASCHILENRWLTDPALAQGSLLTFLDHQRKDGGFRGYIDVDFYRQEMFYHSNLGNAISELHSIHPDKPFLRKIYHGLTSYANYFDRERDAEKSGLYDIDNHYETGQEFMHRYLAVNPNADQDNWGEIFRLKGVDVTVYIYELKKALSKFAGILGFGNDKAKWEQGADFIKRAVREKMWDRKQEMFFDVNPKTGKQTFVKAATCFYPYMTDLVEKEHISGLKRHLLNPNEFWTPFPVPSSSADDEYFSPDAEWKGKRMNCPWNGRVWPMTNSHIVEAVAQSALRFNDHELKLTCAELMTKFIRMMFFDNDPNRPNCFEHYNPFTGEPSQYRGVDDYQHSWIVDILIKYVAGIRPQDDCIVIDPFPFDIESFVLEHRNVRSKEIVVRRSGEKFSVYVEGKKKADSNIGQPIVIQNL